MDKIKFYTMKAKSIPECLGYPLDMIKGLMNNIIDICIDHEKECFTEKKDFSKPVFVNKVMEWLATSTDVDPLIDLDDRNFIFLIDLIINDVMYKYEMSLTWWDATPENKQVLADHFGFMFGFYAHKRQTMMNGLTEQ